MSTEDQDDDDDVDRDELTPDTPLESNDMTFAELEKALDDPSHPRHEEAKELNAQMAANLAPALERMRTAIGQTMQPLLDSVAKAAAASTVHFEPVPPIRTQIVPTIPPYRINPSEGYPARSLAALQSVAANLHEQGQILESTRAEASELNSRQLEVLQSVAANLNGQGVTLESMRVEAEKSAHQEHTLTVRNLWIAAATLVASVADTLRWPYGHSCTDDLCLPDRPAEHLHGSCVVVRDRVGIDVERDARVLVT